MSTDPNEVKQTCIAKPEGPDFKQARSRSVDNLQRLYTFVVSLAFAESLKRAFLTSANNIDLPSHSGKWMMWVALIITAIPFYHGANRYLDATYVTGERSSTNRFSLLIDFFFVFLQALLMFILALLITTGDYSADELNHKLFYWGLALLLSIDIFWIFITRWTTDDLPSPPNKVLFRKWAFINIFAVIIILIFVYFAMWDCLLFLLIARTLADYYIAFDFYYPPPMVN